MKLQTGLILLLVAVIFAICGYLLIESNKRLIREVNRLEANQTVLNDTVKSYLTKSGKQAVSVEQLTYSLKEIKKYQIEDVKTIKDLGLKLKQVENIVKIGLVTNIHDTLFLRDTVIMADTVKCFKKKDKYVDLIGCVRGDSVLLDLSHTDTITNIAHWTYKKWWIFKYKTDKIRLESVNKSPYSQVFMNEFITVKK